MHMAFSFKQRHKTDENMTEYTLKMGSTETNTNRYKIIVKYQEGHLGTSSIHNCKRKGFKIQTGETPFPPNHSFPHYPCKKGSYHVSLLMATVQAKVYFFFSVFATPNQKLYAKPSKDDSETLEQLAEESLEFQSGVRDLEDTISEVRVRSIRHASPNKGSSPLIS